MNKQELVDVIATKAGVTKKDADAVLSAARATLAQINLSPFQPPPFPDSRLVNPLKTKALFNSLSKISQAHAALVHAGAFSISRRFHRFGLTGKIATLLNHGL